MASVITARRTLRVATWHMHGSYLYYLSKVNAEFLVPVKESWEVGYSPLSKDLNWGSNVHMIPAEEMSRQHIDVIVYQSKKNYREDQYELFTERQLALAKKVYIEHDPPRQHPTDTRHVVHDRNVLLVHVTHYNNLMWNSGDVPTVVVEHGVTIPPDCRYTGELPRGVAVINNLSARGRRLGADIFVKLREKIPLDIIGMGTEELGGMGDIPLSVLPRRISKYRFFLNPIRYTSLGLSLCEAMMIGLPIVGLATTELPIHIRNGFNGYIHTDPDQLAHYMRRLIHMPQLARSLSRNARLYAEETFGIIRFSHDWEKVLAFVAGRRKTDPYRPIIDRPGGIL